MNVIAECDVQCPYCGESFVLEVDTTVQDCDMIEDCPVCCHPIEFIAQCAGGEVVRLDVRR